MVVDIRVSVQEFYKKSLELLVKEKVKGVGDFYKVVLTKKSLDARGKQAFFNLRITVFTSKNEYESREIYALDRMPPSDEVVHIIGAGPAGLFAGLKAIQQGIKPVIYERGKKVRDRRRDLVQITQTIVSEKEVQVRIQMVNYILDQRNVEVFLKY